MDAKPQRLARSHTLRDENQLPITLPSKTLHHHRNKSSPALSTQAQVAAAKPAPKRTAFADVTNAHRGPAVTTLDPLLPQKHVQLVLKEKSKENERPAAPLQQPAQRPLSVSSIRGFFNSLSTSIQPEGPSQIPQEAVVRQPTRALSRKSTKVFREPEEPPILDPPLAETHSGAVAPFDNAHVQPWLVEQPTLAQEHPYIANAELLPLRELQNAPADFGREPSRKDLASAVPQAQPMPPLLQPHPIRPSEPLQIPKKVDRRSGSSVQTSYGALPTEQWELEHYVESEGDYTTARSLKSRGECTTNQTTIILAPKLTAAAEREIAEANLFIQTSADVIELEEDEAWDPAMVAEYGDEIFSYMRTIEEQMRPNPHYMDNQTEVQWSMRSVLMDWLVQVHHRFSLLPETLFLCVNYIDRFLSCKVVSLGKLQLVGATAIFVAAKYEEINCPSVQEIVYMVDGGYTIEEILKAERFMLSMLQFELGFPGPMSFLRRISKADDYDLETRTLAKYFMEITIMDERFVGCIPSYTAAGAHCLARLMLDKGMWSHKHVYYSGYTYGQLRPLLLTMLSCCGDPTRHHAAIFDKYADKRFKRASTFVQAELNRGFELPAVTARNSIGYEANIGLYRTPFYS